jgi:LysM repeat protein
MSNVISSVLDPIAATIKNPFGTTPATRKAELRQKDFAYGFTLTEYINGVSQEAKKIRLVGNMMPQQPFPWETEQRLVKDYYPGNPEPVVHVMGNKENGITIHGRFKDKHLKDDSLYGAAYETARALDAMCKRGNLVRFGMIGDRAEWLRYGFIEKVSFKMNKLSWVDYEITLFVVSERYPTNNKFSGQDKDTVLPVVSRLVNAAADFETTYSAIPTTMPQSIADIITDVVNDIAANVALVTNFVDTVVTTASDIAAAASRATGLIKNARAKISFWRRRISQISYAFTGLAAESNAVSQFGSTYKNISFIAEIIAALAGLASLLSSTNAKFRAISTTTPIGRYKVVVGDTLQNVAIRFYGASDNWKSIYDHNKLTSTALTPGVVLEIPKL